MGQSRTETCAQYQLRRQILARTKTEQVIQEEAFKRRQMRMRSKFSGMHCTSIQQCCKSITQHTVFHATSSLVVALNAIWIAVDTDQNDVAVLYAAEMHVQVLEHTFCVFFLAELMLRFCSFPRKL